MKRIMFGKKKDKNNNTSRVLKPMKSAKKQNKTTIEAEPPAEPSPPPRITLKRVMTAIILLAVATSAGFAANTFLFHKEEGRRYVARELPYVNLPPEMMKFSFENLPDLYDAFLIFDRQIAPSYQGDRAYRDHRINLPRPESHRRQGEKSLGTAQRKRASRALAG